MTEHTPMDPFEQRIAGMVRSYTQPAAVSADHLSTARAAMATRASRRASVERAWLPGVDRRLLPVLVAACLVLTAMALAFAGGSKPKSSLDTTPRLVFVRDGDLFVSAIDGTGATLIRAGHAEGSSLGYLSALWSPDMSAIAAVRDNGGPNLVPAIDILDPDGTLQRTIDENPGGTPSISWSPDSRELAITTYPTSLDRKADESKRVPIRLTIAGRDGGSRDVELPPDAVGYAGCQPCGVDDAGPWRPLVARRPVDCRGMGPLGDRPMASGGRR